MATAISFYDFGILPIMHNLRTAISITKKAQEHCTTTSTPEHQLVTARLYPDMYTFHGQIYQLIKGASHLLQRLPHDPSAEIDGGDGSVIDPPNHDGDNPQITTLQQCIDLLTESLTALESHGGRDSPLFSDAQAARMVRVRYPPLPVFDITKKQLVEGMIMPNMYFHTSTAYCILRAQGVPVGKGDFLRPFFEDAVDYDLLMKKAQEAFAEEAARKAEAKAEAATDGN